MPTLDEQIAQSLQESLRNGELQTAQNWGKPMNLDDGYEQTPPELRMAFKALKDAGFVPPEIELMKQIAALRQCIADEPDSPQLEAWRQRASELQQHVALRLEKLRMTGCL